MIVRPGGARLGGSQSAAGHGDPRGPARPARPRCSARCSKLADHVGRVPRRHLDWVERGPTSAFALSPERWWHGPAAVRRTRPGPRPASSSASTCGARSGEEAAIPWWKQAHALFPENWTYKRQAWTLATTAPDAPAPDLIQEAGDVYGTSWLDDVLRLGGGERYYPELSVGGHCRRRGRRAAAARSWGPDGR